MIHPIRRLAYRLGARPKPGSILYSPSLDAQLAWRELGPLLRAAMDRAAQQMERELERSAEMRRFVDEIQAASASIPPLPQVNVCANCRKGKGVHDWNGRCPEGGTSWVPSL